MNDNVTPSPYRNIVTGFWSFLAVVKMLETFSFESR